MICGFLLLRAMLTVGARESMIECDHVACESMIYVVFLVCVCDHDFIVCIQYLCA